MLWLTKPFKREGKRADLIVPFCPSPVYRDEREQMLHLHFCVRSRLDSLTSKVAPQGPKRVFN